MGVLPSLVHRLYSPPAPEVVRRYLEAHPPIPVVPETFRGPNWKDPHEHSDHLGVLDGDR